MKSSTKFIASIAVLLMVTTSFTPAPVQNFVNLGLEVCAEEYSDAVSNFKQDSSSKQIVLSWDIVPSATNYKVEIKTTEKNAQYSVAKYTLVKTKDDRIKATITGLKEDTNYTVKVTPLKKSGDKTITGKSKTVSVKTSAAYTYSGKINKINLEKATDTTLSLNWDKVKGAYTYRVYIKTGTGKYKKIDTKLTSNDNTITAKISGLNPGVKYSVKICPVQKKNEQYFEGQGKAVSVRTSVKNMKSIGNLPSPTLASSNFIFDSVNDDGDNLIYKFIADFDTILSYYEYLARNGYDYREYTQHNYKNISMWTVYDSNDNYIGLLSFDLYDTDALLIVPYINDTLATASKEKLPSPRDYSKKFTLSDSITKNGTTTKTFLVSSKNQITGYFDYLEECGYNVREGVSTSSTFGYNVYVSGYKVGTICYTYSAALGDYIFIISY